MRILLLLIASLCFIGCASAPPAEPPPAFQCPAGEFQGSGFGATEGEALNMAHGELAKQINMSVKVTVESSVSQRMAGGEESLSSDYASKTVMEAALSNAHDARIGSKERSGNRTSVTLCMSRADLINHYAARTEARLGEAQGGIGLARKLLELGKPKEAKEKLNDSKKYIDSTASHRMLLAALDAQSGRAQAQGEKAGEMLKEIESMRAEIEAAEITTVFVTGTESITALGLQTILSENNIKLAETEKEATYILKIEASICNSLTDGRFHYANACAKINLSSAKTGKSEAFASITGPKEGSSLGADKAAEKAFKAAIPEAWARIKDKLLEANSEKEQ